MFLDEIEKDEIGYAEYCKNKVKEYFVNFFDKKYEKQIERRMDDTPLIFVNNKHQQFQSTDIRIRIDYEINLLYKNWFFKSFEGIEITNEILDEHISIFEEALFEEDEEIINKVFKKITNSQHNLTTSEIKNCKKLFETEFENDINKLNIVKYKLIKERENFEKISSFDDIKQNKFIAKNFENLNNSKKNIIVRAYSRFTVENDLDGDFSYFSRLKLKNKNDIQHREKFKFIAYKDMRITYQQAFVHELLHAISFSENIKHEANGIKTIYKNGFKTIIDYLNNTERNTLYRSFSFLNEILTDYFAYKITNRMLEDGNKLFISKMLGSTYSLCFVLVKPFFDKYFEELKDCYMTRDFTKIPNFFGEQNLDELNYLLIDFAGYSITFLEKGITLASNFEEGLSASKLPESPFVLPVINKYNACFGKMDKIMKDIENFVNNRNNEVLNKLF